MKLTPEQFEIARAIARAHNHAWACVPDGMFETEEIEAYTRLYLAERKIVPQHGGVLVPTIVGTSVVHTTHHKLATWEVASNGNIAYTLYQDGMPVAKITILNEDAHSVSLHDLSRSTSDDTYWNEANFKLDHTLREDLLQTTHLKALERFLTPCVQLACTSSQNAQFIVAFYMRYYYERILPPSGKVSNQAYWLDKGAVKTIHHKTSMYVAESAFVAAYATQLIREQPLMTIRPAIITSINTQERIRWTK